MANTTYTVVAGDTLSKIASEYNTTIDKLVSLNKLPDPDFIIIGQVLVVSGTAVTVKKNTSSKAVIRLFGIQSNSNNGTMYATWTWDKTNTENYKVVWEYNTGDGVWFIDNESTTTNKQSTYSIPENATQVRFKVQPISKTRTVNKKETKYWTASWSTYKVYDFKNKPPLAPPIPQVTLDDLKLTAKLENLDLNTINAVSIQFKVVQDDSKIYKTSDTTIRTITNSAQYACYVTTGSSYKVACRSVRGNLFSDWSDFSAPVTTKPAAPTGITECMADAEKVIYLKWDAVPTAKSYDIQYATKLEFLDSSNAASVESGIETNEYYLEGLEMGSEYFFRVRAVNDAGESAWSPVKSIPLGTKPISPTTWSSTTSAIVGEDLNLYWVHNSEDQSSQVSAILELDLDGVISQYTIAKSTDPEERYKTSVYPFVTAGCKEGAVLKWRVKTAGVMKDENGELMYGEWSIQRTVNIYAQPTLALDVPETITSFPFIIEAAAGPASQTPISYHMSIIADAMYETTDEVGNTKIVNKGEAVYSKYFDVSHSTLLVEFSAYNVDLENNIPYVVSASVTMDSGLTAESEKIPLSVSWEDAEYEPGAEIAIDSETLSASIRPYYENDEGVLIDNVLLSVYRREFDGSFTEIIKNVDNSASVFVTDPHPSLDYARYRIVATDTVTGAVSFSDVPAFPVGETAVIIQWDEDWTFFDTSNEDQLVEPSWSGSMLKLPYNIDVNDMHNADVALIEYIGRKRPVSYYGTQLGESSTWNVDIVKSDKETLYALRRLAMWMGDVYVREPSGSGYWANIAVSFNQKHTELTIPVTLNIKRVEGGI
jgi:LysM repeat protein